MVIADALAGVKVTVVVDDIALQEYENDDDQDSHSMVTRYVEAVSDQGFAVHMFIQPDCKFKGDSISFRILVDGKWAISPIVFAEDVYSDGLKLVRSGKRESETTVRRFRFAGLERTETPSTQAPSQLKELGTIRVTAHHMRRGGRVAMDPHQSMASIAPVSAVSEKVLKGQAVSHSVRFSEPQRARASTYWDATPIDSLEAPAATYEFKYRSKAALQSLYIIPRTPSPDPEAETEALENRDVTTLTPDELRELQRRAKEAREMRQQEVKVKPEPRSPRRRKTRRSDEITTIELGDDGEIIRETTTKITRDTDSAVDLDD